jgi:hypothetical protein
MRIARYWTYWSAMLVLALRSTSLDEFTATHQCATGRYEFGRASTGGAGRARGSLSTAWRGDGVFVYATRLNGTLADQWAGDIGPILQIIMSAGVALDKDYAENMSIWSDIISGRRSDYRLPASKWTMLTPNCALPELDFGQFCWVIGGARFETSDRSR